MLGQLPVELVELIVGYLRLSDLQSINLCCKRLRLIVMPRMWTNLLFTLHKQSKDSLLYKNKHESKSAVHMVGYGGAGVVWMVIDDNHVEQFRNYLQAGKLCKQLNLVKSINFDEALYFHHPPEPIPSKPPKSARIKLAKWLKRHSLNLRVDPNAFQAWIDPTVLPNVQAIRIAISEVTPREILDISINILQRFGGASTHMVTPGGLASQLCIHHISTIKQLDLTLDTASDLPLKLPSQLTIFELYAPHPVVIDAGKMQQALSRLHHLRALTMTNVSLTNTAESPIVWLPSHVQLLSVSVHDSNYLEGKLGGVVELPGVRKLIVDKAFGFVSRIMPTKLECFEVNGEGVKSSWVEEVLRRNPTMLVVSLPLLTVPILRALSSVSIGALELTICRTERQAWENLHLLMMMKQVGCLTLVYPAFEPDQIEIDPFAKIPYLAGLHVVHCNQRMAELFSKLYSGNFTRIVHGKSGLTEFIMHLNKF